MRVQILEKIYHSCETLTLLTSFCRTRELVQPNHMASMTKSKGVGSLSSISCKKTNIYSLFNKQPRRKRSHGKEHYNKRAPQPDVAMSTLVDLVDMIEKHDGVHKININCFPFHFHSFVVYKNLLWSQQTLITLLLSIE